MDDHRFKGVIRTVTFIQPPSTRHRYTLPLTILLGVISGLLLISTIILASLYGIERSRWKPDGNSSVALSNETSVDICLTPYCIKAANYFLDSIDETVDPCDNFYQFACGKWIKQAAIPSYTSVQDIFEQIQSRVDANIVGLLSSSSSSSQSNQTGPSKPVAYARRLYASCVDEEAIETQSVDALLNFINHELGGWPILEGSAWQSSTFNLSKLLVKLNQYNRFIFFDINTYLDEENSSVNCIYMGQGSLALADRSYYANETKITQAYRNLMRNIAVELTNDTSMIETDVNDTYEFERKLAQYFWTTAEQYAGDYYRTTFANLSFLMNTTFDFKTYLQAIYRLGNVTMKDTDRIIVSELDVLRNVSMIIHQERPRILQNYLVGRFVMSQLDFLPKRFRLLKQEFIKVFYGIGIEGSRSFSCAKYVTRNMGLAVAKLYISKYFDKDARQESLMMIENIREVFTSMINQSTWMDLFSKNVALEKIRAINQRIGYPDGLDSENSTDLDKQYGEYNFNSNYLENGLKLSLLKAKKKFERLREPIDRNAWLYILPTDVNAYYRPSFNDITFTAAILQTPFFNKDAPKYLNYGGIGMVIGHEFTHGFDNIGRQFDKDGNRIQWWTNETIEAYEKQKQCMIDQYNNYTVTQINMQVNGDQTQGENIADNVGLKQAFHAYQRWAKANPHADQRLPGLSQYSAEQMLFLSFGQIWCTKATNQYLKNALLTDVHSPAEFRVLGSTSNMPEFDRVFGCKPGQNNSRINKCQIW